MSDVLIGVTLPQFTDDAESFVASAQRAESLGLDSLWVFDHLWPLSGGKNRPILEGWTALSWLAGATDRAGIGTLVTRSSLRHPAVLAKMAASVACAAPGRVTLVIGSGDEMSRAENEAFGIPYYEGPDRIEQFKSTVRVLREFLDTQEITVKDEFVSIERLPVSPRPASKPRLWVAGRSDDALEIAGAYGDGWNGWAGTPERFAQDALRVTEFAASSGDRAVALTWGGLAMLGKDDEDALAKLGSRNPKQYLVGGPETIARRLGEFVLAGARHLVLTFPDAGETGSYELLADQVKPLLDRG